MPRGQPTQQTLDRRARRQSEIRARLLDSAHTLVAEVGPEAVTITEITRRADLGNGTFYNYFASRDEIVNAVIESSMNQLGMRLDAMTHDMDDAAEIVASSLRHLMTVATSDPVWGWFMVRLGSAHPALLAVFGPRATRDVKIGIDTGRFDVPNLPMIADIFFSSLLSGIRIHLQRPHGDDVRVLAEYCLRMCGLSAQDAAEVCTRPLPKLPSYDEALQTPLRTNYPLSDFVGS